MADVVHQLVATERALDKLAARSILAHEPTQLRHNRYVVVHNPHDPERRRFLIGSTAGGRVLALVIEQTVDPTTWLIVTAVAPPRPSVESSAEANEQGPLDRPRSAAGRS